MFMATGKKYKSMMHCFINWLVLQLINKIIIILYGYIIHLYSIFTIGLSWFTSIVHVNSLHKDVSSDVTYT